jgi:protocatechuate 3,4-dioxygenase beta subunit
MMRRSIRISQGQAVSSQMTKAATVSSRSGLALIPGRTTRMRGARRRSISHLFGPCFLSRLVTQMYFPDDPLFDYDPMFTSAEPKARQRMVSRFSLDMTIPEWGLGFEWDIILRGTNATPMEQ